MAGVLGLLPAIRGGLGDLARTGQHSRLLDGYLERYIRAFDEVRYFSYLRESLADFTDDADLRARVRLIPGARVHPWLYALAMPAFHARAMAGCGVLRVFQVTGTIPAVIARRLFGVPFVTTYGFWYAELARSRATHLLRRTVERLGLRAADAVIATTPELAADVQRRHPRADVHVIPNGVDTERFRPRARRSDAPPTVLYAGRFSEEKNLDVLIEAAGKLASRIPFRLMLIGDGDRRAALEAQAGSLRLAVDFRRFVDHREMPFMMAGADVFVLPSRTEGHPKILLEAMSSGLACVASAVPGNRALVDDGRTGVLVAPGDAGALAEALERVLVDADERRDLGERARAAIAARYDLGALVDREIALLQRVAQNVRT